MSTVPVLKVAGPFDETNDSHAKALLDQINGIPKDAPALRIEHDTPSDTEWGLLGRHFTSLKDLELEAGWNEELNDITMPNHWPLERLLISSSCGTLVQSPYILDAKVKHLIFMLTAGLRFEGPTNAELLKDSAERGDERTTIKGPDGREVTVTSIPSLASKYLFDRYASGKGGQLGAREQPEEIHIQALEIIENDATDTFNRMTMAMPYLTMLVSTLVVRSTNGCDLKYTPEDIFSQFLRQMPSLETLVLSLGDIFMDPDHLPGFHANFPPTLTTLRFRGPVSLALDPRWDEWVSAFEKADYLPKLKTLSFVLDLDYPARKAAPGELEEHGSRRPVDVTLERLQEARAKCEKLYAAARKRGITIEPFVDSWAEGRSHLSQVDSRWEQ